MGRHVVIDVDIVIMEHSKVEGFGVHEPLLSWSFIGGSII